MLPWNYENVTFYPSIKIFISIFFTCQVSACGLQPFSCHDLANDIYSITDKTVFSHLNILISVIYCIRLYVRAKQLVFHLSPRYGHVLIVSGCLISQLSIHSHTDGLHNWQASVDIWERSNVTLDIGLHVMGARTVGVRTLRHDQIFLPMVRSP